MKQQKLILDTNLWLSLLISKKIIEFENLIIDKSIVLIYSEESLFEINDVVKRDKFRKYFSIEASNFVIHLFETYGIYINIISNITICRDTKDNFLLNLAVDGNADYLITGDKDLLILEKINNTKIITIADFKLKL